MKLILPSTHPLFNNIITDCVQKSKIDTQKNKSKKEAFPDQKEVIKVSTILIKT